MIMLKISIIHKYETKNQSKKVFMKKKSLFLLIVFSFFSQFTNACTCSYPPTFCEGIVNADGDIYVDIIIRGKIITKIKEVVKVKVDQIIFGNTTQSFITIGASVCGYPPKSFNKGDEYILVLSKPYFSSSQNHSLIMCKVNYLKIEDEVIKGRIAPGIKSLDYSDLWSLKNQGDKFNLFSIEHSFFISQNPTANILNIKNISLANSTENIQIDVIDITGEKRYFFKKKEGIFASETWAIDLQNFPDGIYFFNLTAFNQKKNIKIVKY